MRLVIYNGAQYDADNLPAHVPADQCVPHDEWFKQNAVVKPRKPAAVAPPVTAKTDDTVSVAESVGRKRKK